MIARDWDVIVIGGGHAGTEAAHAAARMGCRTALMTLNPSRIGFMSCNPAMGGLAKGQLVKEIDALGGIMGINTDKTAIQYRRLNSSKGPAVRSSRAQCDKALYAIRMQEHLRSVLGLEIVEGEVSEIWVEESSVRGVIMSDGSRLGAKAVVVTSGTFLRALMYTGFDSKEGGRAGDLAAKGLSASLERLGFRLRRLKTGTPPRLHRKSIAWDRVEPQPGDEHPVPFSFWIRTDPFPFLTQVNCFITYTNQQAHEIIEQNFDKSPMFTGMIQGVGPRYCPSIEDKVKRFIDKERHQLFLEPEGLTTDEIYVNGISTSLPSDVQEKFVRSIVGLEKAEFIRFGYAVEYDAIDARSLRATLESKDVAGLFFGGQVNGTSGYEEAGAQGLIAGINAARKAKGEERFVLERSDGYIGVLVDDLITHGADEPYRMFTSRAEYRLLLREDNADLRLAEKGFGIGLLPEGHFRKFESKRAEIERWSQAVRTFSVFAGPSSEAWFKDHGLNPLKEKTTGEALLRRPEISWDELCSLGFAGEEASSEVREQVEIQTKYAGYIQRDFDLLEGIRRQESMMIPASLDFDTVSGLSNEIKERLRETRPETLGQVSRMPGVTPSAVASLMIHLVMKSRPGAQGPGVVEGTL